MFVQNPFGQEFIATFQLGDRRFSPNFKVPAHRTQNEVLISNTSENYDLSTSGNETLTVNFAFDRDFKNYASIGIDVSGATASATTAAEIVNALNADTTFSDYFNAQLRDLAGQVSSGSQKVLIKSRKGRGIVKYYISNTGAETVLRFNRYAGVAEVPEFFRRHTVPERFNFTDSANSLIALSQRITSITAATPGVITSANHGLSNGDSILIANSNSDPTIDGTRTVANATTNTFTVGVTVTTAGDRGDWMSAIQQTIITDAGFTPSSIKTDWELLTGRAFHPFVFKKSTVVSDQVRDTIEYPAGAKVGDLAKKTLFTYNGGSDLNPIETTVIPWVLTSDDLITPP